MSTVFQISDCHLSDESSFQNLEKALNVANADSDCDTILLTGDICCGPKSGDYTKLLSFVSQHVDSKKQVYAIAGNHDDIVLMKDELKGSLIQVVDQCEIAGRDFIFLDSSQKPIDAQHPLGSGRIDNRGIAHLRKQIRKKKDPIVVVHHPVIRVGSNWMKLSALRTTNRYSISLSNLASEKLFVVMDMIILPAPKKVLRSTWRQQPLMDLITPFLNTIEVNVSE